MNKLTIILLAVIFLSGCSPIEINMDKGFSDFNFEISTITGLNFFEGKEADKAKKMLTEAEEKMTQGYRLAMQQAERLDPTLLEEVKSDLKDCRVALKNAEEAFKSGDYKSAMEKAVLSEDLAKEALSELG